MVAHLVIRGTNRYIPDRCFAEGIKDFMIHVQIRIETQFSLFWRGLRPQPKVAITLRRDEHLPIDIHQP